MKLLVLIHRLPCPPDRGAKLRAMAELRYLTARHEVWCAGFMERPEAGNGAVAEQITDELRGACSDLYFVPLRPALSAAKAAWGQLIGGTATEYYFGSGRLERQVLSWSRRVQFDAVLAFSSSMAPLALKVPAGQHVLDMVDVDSRKWAESAAGARWPMSLLYRTEARRLYRRECQWAAEFDATILVNQREIEQLHDDVPTDRLHIIETGAASGAASDSSAGSTELRLPDEPIVGFLGAMDYPPNVDGARWFAESVWPLVRARRPDAQWWIIGRSPARAVRELDNGQDIRVTGTVPAVEPYLAQLRVNVAPLLLARGVQTKVLAAMGAGRPCVVTPCVAEGIGAQVGRDLLVAASPGEFAAAILELLEDRYRAEAMARSGLGFVRQQFDADRGLARLEGLLSGAVEPLISMDTRGMAASQVELPGDKCLPEQVCDANQNARELAHAAN